LFFVFQIFFNPFFKQNKFDQQTEEDHKAQEQARLEEILNMCAEFERQNQNPTNNRRPPLTHSPIVQNRIKTNGSLTRDKKPLGEYSPLYTPEKNSKQNIFFPDEGHNRSASPSNSSNRKSSSSSSGYENVKIGFNGRVEITPILKQSTSQTSGNQLKPPTNGYENVQPKNGGYIPQSPRTRIKTCPSLSPSPSPRKEIPVNQKNDYDMIIQCFEEKLKLEIKQLQDNNFAVNTQHEVVAAAAAQRKGSRSSLTRENGLDLEQQLTNGECRSVEVLQSERSDILTTIRNLKTKLSDLQRQEDEVMREVSVNNWISYTCFIIN
jgi:pleckstrin homology-like domain family B